MSGFRLLAIHAHPDDEASKGAATMIRYAREGNETMVVTCTGGERGDILNPAMNRPGVLERIPEIRKEEMAEAIRLLGAKHRWLGYVDSGLPQSDPLAERAGKAELPAGCFALQDTDTVVQDLVQVIREFRPHVIITYDENGGYPHPDHLKVHETSMVAWDKAGDPDYHPELGKPWAPLKLYYTHGFIRQRLQMFHDLLIEEGKTSPELSLARLLTYNRSCGQPKNSNLRPPGFGPRFRRMTCSPGFRRTATTTSRTPC